MNVDELAASYYGERNVKRYLLRRNDVLAQLRTLSDVDAVRHSHAPTAPQPDSAVPRGVRVLWKVVPTPGDRPPEKDRSLFDHFAWRFSHEVGANIEYGNLLCAEAEDDYIRRVRRPIAMEDTVDRDRRILSAYRGKSPAHVAAYEHVGVVHVLRLRHANNLDPITGFDPVKDNLASASDPNLAPRVAEGSLAIAREFLRIILGEGPLHAEVVRAYADEAHITGATLKRAKKELGVQSVKNGAGWLWVIPQGGPSGSKVVNGDQIGQYQ